MTASRYGPSPAAVKNLQKTGWNRRGYSDAKARRSKMSREALLKAGGELAVRAYLDGYRSGGR